MQTPLNQFLPETTQIHHYAIKFFTNFNTVCLTTGMDALIAQLRDGTVTLRKSRRRTESNAALQEMFATLELSRKQNRSSRLVVDGHIGSSY